MTDETRNPWTTLGSKNIYDNPWIRVTECDVLRPDKNKGIYGIVHFKHSAVGIIPLDEEGTPGSSDSIVIPSTSIRGKSLKAAHSLTVSPCKRRSGNSAKKPGSSLKHGKIFSISPSRNPSQTSGRSSTLRENSRSSRQNRKQPKLCR